MTAGGRSPRQIALALLTRIRRTKAYANLVFASAQELDALDTRDRALVTRLVYGTLQMEGSLDAALEHVAARGSVRVPPSVGDALRLGAYQLLFTDIPVHAAIKETVGAIPVRPAESWRGVANALLRALAKQRAGFPWIEPTDDPVMWLALTHGHPSWLVERLLAEYGQAATESLLAADNEPAPVHLRVNTLATTRSGLVAKLAQRGYRVATGSLYPEAIVVGGPPGVWREPEAGREFIIQDMGSLMAPHMLAPQAGERVLDMAAGRGGKATHLAALMDDIGTVLALDVFETKAARCKEMAERLGVTAVECRTADARRLADAVARGAEQPFDAVLLDAPCSGTGTLRRRVEVRWRRTPADVERVKALQGELLGAAARLTRSGGRLVFTTCSVLPEENEGQVERFLHSDAGAGWRLVEARQLLPSRDGTDGHFAALMVHEPESQSP